MSNSKIFNNSISPNGIQKDVDGYAVFYPMGTNKVDIPKNSPYWPKGSKLVGSFVYDKNNKLVGFCDTKAMTSDGGLVIMPYEEIDVEFDSISNGDIQIHAPKATAKKASWSGSVKEDIPDVQYKYKGCKTITAIKAVDENYLENDIIDGKWTELLSDLVDGMNMFRENENITSFTSDLSSLTHGDSMFHGCSNLISFEADLRSLEHAVNTFQSCKNLTSFTSNLSSLKNGYYMFESCSNLTKFESDLNYLEGAIRMFKNCSNLTTFKSPSLNCLTNGSQMFDGCSNLLSFSSDLSSLIYGDWMFSDCSNLISFNTSDLRYVTNGTGMFGGCSKLVPSSPFIFNLKSLTDGRWMFAECKLDAPSIKNIINTINTVESANLTLGMGCDNNAVDKDLFAQEVGYSDMNTLLTTLQNKGWIVSAQYNGRPSTNYSLRQPESLPVFVKLEEVVPTEENSFYEYTSIDGSKFYNLDWFHETTGSTDGYTQFNSLEEAITHFKLLNKA